MTENQNINSLMLSQASQLGEDTFIRYDQNFTRNVFVYSECKGDKKLIEDIILYLSLSYQYNYFGYGIFDPAHFSEKTIHTLKYLQNKTKGEILQLEGYSPEKVKMVLDEEKKNPHMRIFKSNLENALYSIATYGITTVSGMEVWNVNSQGKRFNTKIKNMKIFDSFEIDYIKDRPGKDKIIYRYTLSEDFITNMSHYYTVVSLESKGKLRKTKGAGALYLRMAQLRSQEKAKGNNRITLDFTVCCNILGLNDGKYDKPNQKKRINAAFKKIKELSELNFDVDWTKSPNSNYKYVPLITFELTDEEQKIMRDPDALELFKKEAKSNIFKQIRIHEMVKMFKHVKPFDYYTDRRISLFTDWMNDNGQNLKEKQLAYDNSIFKTYGKLARWNDAAKAAFFRLIKERRTLDQIFEVPESCFKESYDFIDKIELKN